MKKDTEQAFSALEEIVSRIRRECPWDSVQTCSSLIPCLQNELAEVVEGIEDYEKTKDASGLCEELGDLLFLIMLEAAIAQEKGDFSIKDVMDGAAYKMCFRHPKIFSPENRYLCGLSWEELKKEEKRIRREIRKQGSGPDTENSLENLDKAREKVYK